MSTDIDTTLRITEIFFSLQGETRTVGLPTVFIRLTGCPLRCTYCDTTYAFTGGETKTIQNVLNEVESYHPKFVTVTGGEPLAQKNVHHLLSALCDTGYEVSLETSGAIDISKVDPRVVVVLDLKTPASGELSKNKLSNLECLKITDQVKFVICDRDDYIWAKQMVETHQLDKKCEVLFSPVHGSDIMRPMAEWILQDHLNVRYQLQLHKYLWNDEPGH